MRAAGTATHRISTNRPQPRSVVVISIFFLIHSLLHQAPEVENLLRSPKANAAPAKFIPEIPIFAPKAHTMLGLQLPTDPTWVKNVVEGNISEILTDHAYCEQKAASHAISLILTFPEYPELVDVMADLAQEEMAHFKLVHALIQQRGFALGRERKDDYVGELMKFVRRGRGHDILLMDRLLFAAMIEARSCERFKVLHDHISDRELAQFYYDLMASEARHYTTFLKLAKQYLDPEAVEARWKEWLAYEAEVIQHYGQSERIHG